MATVMHEYDILNQKHREQNSLNTYSTCVVDRCATHLASSVFSTIWLFTYVCKHVPVKTATFSKSLLANVTPVQSFTAVYLPMYLQMAILCKPLATHIAFVRPQGTV